MRTRMVCLVAVLALEIGGFTALSLIHGQEQSERAPPGPIPVTPPAGVRAARDLSRYSPLQQQMFLAAQRGTDWLRRANRSDGRFVHGYIPSLKRPLEGDHYLRQAGATLALARAARFLGDESYLAVARQAILTLLLDTAADPQDPLVRHTTLPSVVVNRLAAAGLLVAAINELPVPGEDILAQSEQLCVFIRKQQQADGSLSYTDSVGDRQAIGVNPDGPNLYPGPALYGLMLSQRHRPAAWKTDLLRKAVAFYHPWWRAHKNSVSIPWQTAAFTEAYLLTREAPFAAFVTDMNDWLCRRQYTQLDPRHPLWVGGFMEGGDSQPLAPPPQATSAAHAESLADACRVARQLGDLTRYPRYREALERCLQFVTTLQYTEANTQHFADWYRPVLHGGFHASHQDGTLRLDYTQHAVCALVQYLLYVGE